MTNLCSKQGLWHKSCRQIIPKTFLVFARQKLLKWNWKKSSFMNVKNTFISFVFHPRTASTATARLERVSILITSGHFSGRNNEMGSHEQRDNHKMHNRPLARENCNFVSHSSCAYLHCWNGQSIGQKSNLIAMINKVIKIGKNLKHEWDGMIGLRPEASIAFHKSKLL